MTYLSYMKYLVVVQEEIIGVDRMEEEKSDIVIDSTETVELSIGTPEKLTFAGSNEPVICYYCEKEIKPGMQTTFTDSEEGEVLLCHFMCLVNKLKGLK